MDNGTLLSKVNKYKQILENTNVYRMAWHEKIKPMLIENLTQLLQTAMLPKAEVIIRENIENLEAVILDLGRSSSGISENLEKTGVKRTMVKFNGSLVYQQLFNGKIMIMVMTPYIEGYGEPKAPITLEILRPDELSIPFVIRHLETFFKDIAEWEDFDDDQPQRSPATGFNPIGYNIHHDQDDEV
jgi:hypothetical protein